MAPIFPANVFDEPDRLLQALGSFWANTYAGSFPVRSLLHARAQLDAQNHLDLLHLIAAMSRTTVPIFRRDNWYLLQLRESERNITDASLAVFDGAHTFDGEINWGVPLAAKSSTWLAPTALASVKLALNRITGASLTLTHGVDFLFDATTRAITFRDNPFDSELVEISEIVEDNELVDREAALWLYCGDFDFNTVYRQFGYALGVHLASSDGYRDLINAIFEALVDGGTQRSVDRVFAAVAGVPLATSGEKVEHLLDDGRHLWIVTDRHAHRHHRHAIPAVAIGDVLTDSQSMTDTLAVYEFGSGQVNDELRALVVPVGHLASGFFADIVFENKTVPLAVEEDVDGYTKVSFEVGGFPGDVIEFWSRVHRSGVTDGQTLAMLLDQRPADARDTQPTAPALPATVNPLGFLLSNVFRNNLYVVVVKPTTFGPGALGLHNATALRKVVPPHTAVMVVVTLAATDDPVILDALGDDLTPGYVESVHGYSATFISEGLAPAGLVTEDVRGRQMSGRCV